MNWTFSRTLIAACVLTATANAATLDGTVTNKTTGKPSAGDKVALVDLSAGMADAATAVTNSQGKYTLQASVTGSYLIRVDHQGASYFIAAPDNGFPADITVYDVAPKVEGVGIDADMLLIEAGQGTLHVRERYLVRNASSPPRTQFSENTFEVVLPEGAQLEEAAATRPGGMGTRTHLIPLAQKGHYSFNVPIQPDQGEKETMFEVAYHFPYNGRQTITIHPIAPANHLVVYTAQGIDFAAKDASRFRAARDDARVETHVALNTHTGEEIAFTISGEGHMPPDTGPAALGGSNANLASSGQGIGASAGSPDSLTGSKLWMLAGCTILLAGGFLVLLYRRKNGPNAEGNAPATVYPTQTPPSLRGPNTLLDGLKEELFALEQDKISGRVAAEEYLQTKAGLEAILKRALNSQSR